LLFADTTIVNAHTRIHTLAPEVSYRYSLFFHGNYPGNGDIFAEICGITAVTGSECAVRSTAGVRTLRTVILR